MKIIISLEFIILLFLNYYKNSCYPFITFVVTANSGYATPVTVGGSCAGGTWSGTTYTTGAITADCTVTFSATLMTSTVTPSGSHVTLSPSTAQTVNYNSTQSFTVTASTGYSLSNTVGGTCPAGSWSGSTYTTGAITSSCTLSFSASTPIYMYESNSSYSGQNVGSRTTTTNQCHTDYTSTYSGSITCSNFVALLGYSATAGVTTLAATFSVPTSLPILNISGTQISSSISAFIALSAPPYAEMTGTGFASTQAWTGFVSGGALPGGSNNGNCNDWASSGFGGEAAQFLNSLNDSWGDESTCSTGYGTYPYLCLCW